MTFARRLKTEFTSLVALAIGVAAIGISSMQQSESPRVNPKPIWLYVPHELKYFTLGYNEMIADSLWIRLLQDMDVCDQTNAEKGELTLPPEMRGGAPVKSERPKSVCSEGWAYRMIDAITELAPRFDAAYDIGGTMLSVLVDDAEGGLKILKKGAERFPDKWMIHFRLGFHYLYALHDIEKAAPEFAAANRLGGPDWLAALSARLYTKSGQIQMGITVLEQEIERAQSDDVRQVLQRKLEALKKDLRETK